MTDPGGKAKGPQLPSPPFGAFLMQLNGDPDDDDGRDG